jgi:hypothetical protein
METVLNLLLLRFGILALGVVVLALGAFAVLVALRRRGRIESARRGAEQLARLGTRYLETRADRRRAGLGETSARAALRHLADGGRGGDRDRR